MATSKTQPDSTVTIKTTVEYNDKSYDTLIKIDAKDIVNLIHSLDPFSGRPVSANQNGYIGPNTPLDVQGFDYSTGSYDGWHKEAPNIPSISSETSSAVGDRGEYANNATTGHVSAYDNQYPGWGESAEQAVSKTRTQKTEKKQ